MKMFLRAALSGLAALAFAATASAQKSDEEMFKLMKSEKIGELKLEMTEAQLKQALPGQPAKAADRLWGADGQYHQRWTYAKQGLRLSMVSEKKGAAKTVESIECAARCTLKSARGIGVGSTVAALRAAYGTALHDDNGMYVVGRGDRALSFDVGGDGTVNAIYLGLSWD